MTKQLPRGLRNNNPGNIRINKDKFQGEILPSGDKSFKQFSSMDYGYRAMFVSLHTYLVKYGRNTIRKIVSAWAPPSENNTESYIRNVAKNSGVPADQVLSANSGDEYIRIVAAISKSENGVNANMAEVTKGFNLQNKIKKQ